MFSLGEIFYDQHDFDEAFIWFNRAMEAGHARSLYWMGMLYWKGRGVPMDKATAKRLFQQAAEKKVNEAQRLLKLWNHLAKTRRSAG